MSTAESESEVIHRLKNHLAIIVGFSELLLEDVGPDDPRRGDLEEIVAAARAAVAMMPDVSKLVR